MFQDVLSSGILMQVNKSASDRDGNNPASNNVLKTDFDSDITDKKLNDSVIINDDFEDDEN